jgi:hypothetical protein
MRKIFLPFLIVLGLFFSSESVPAAVVARAVPVPQGTSSGFAEGPMTALDVIQMSCAGLSDSVIINKMDAAGAFFDISVADIIELKNAGVSDPVINHMITAGNVPAGNIAAQAIPAASPVTYVSPAAAYVVPQTTYIVERAVPPVSLNFSFGSFRRAPPRRVCWAPPRGAHRHHR